MTEKSDHLVVHDYQTGGVWGIVHARSRQEIEARYLNIEVVPERPAWILDDQYQRLLRSSRWDIDDVAPDWVLPRSSAPSRK